MAIFQSQIQANLSKSYQAEVGYSPDPVDWIERHFYIPETQAPIKLQPYQRAVIRELLRRDEQGSFVYSQGLWSDLKKSAKSTIAGAIGLYLAWHYPWESVRIVGNDLKQADSRTFFYIVRAIRLNLYLRKACQVKQYQIDLPNHTRISAIPVDPKGEAGGGDLCTIFTELWAMKNKASQQLWSETTLSPLKFGKSLRLAESYAGFRGESPVLEPLYESGVVNGERIDLSHDGVDLSDLEVYRNGRMLTLWNKKPRCPWQTPEYYAQEEVALTPSEMRRIHGNEWADAIETFVPMEWWLGCKAAYPAVESGEPVIVACDAGVSSDCFGVIMVTRRKGKVQVQYVRKWQPHHGQRLDYAPIEAEIRRLVRTYNVIELTYDEYQLVDMMARIRSEEVVNARVFSQASARAIADKRLFDLIRDKRIEHQGEPDLDTHIRNAHRKKEDENRLRIVKGADQNQKIDLAVSLSMAVDRSFAYALD